MLLDASLLGANSSEAINALKERSHSQDVPVIGLGATAPDEVQLAAMGLAGWVTKPVDEGSLLLALESVLGKPGESPRVLVIEDDVDLARVLTTVFERHGAVVIHAQTGQEAVRVCPQFIPDLLVLDVILPELDGFGVVEQLRQHEHLQHLPVAVYSVKELDDAEKARLRLGESIFMTKSRLTPQEFEQRAIGLLNWATSGQRERRRAMSTRRILIVDDEDDIREVAQVSLEMVAGWEVLTASSGSAGLAIASADQPDAILLDVMMPDMDGPTTFQKLQADLKIRNIPVILLTAKLQPTDRNRFAELRGSGSTGETFRPPQVGQSGNRGPSLGRRNRSAYVLGRSLDMIPILAAGVSSELVSFMEHRLNGAEVKTRA